MIGKDNPTTRLLSLFTGARFGFDPFFSWTGALYSSYQTGGSITLLRTGIGWLYSDTSKSRSKSGIEQLSDISQHVHRGSEKID